jgi:hypothetical protein
MAIKKPTSSIATPSKIYPNWDFWFENIPSGNTVPFPLYKAHSLQEVVTIQGSLL